MDFNSIDRIGINFDDLDLLKISWDEFDKMSPAHFAALLQTRIQEIERTKILDSDNRSKAKKLIKALSNITESIGISAAYDIIKEAVKFLLQFIR